VPDTSTVLVECVADSELTSYYVHTPLHRAANDALARVACLRLARGRGRTITSLVADLGFALFVMDGAILTTADFRALLAVEGFAADLDEEIAGSIALRERFRRVALTGLMLLRNPIGRRRRVGGEDWAQRRLFAQVQSDCPQFVLLRQAEREVRESCAAEEALAFVADLAGRSLRCRWLPSISPFVEAWTQSAPGPAEVVESPDETLRRLHAELTQREAV
jgi:Lhr-like helicase